MNPHHSAPAAIGRQRRRLLQLGTLCMAAGRLAHSASALAQPPVAATPQAFTRLREQKPLAIGIVIFPRMDQIDFTGPFEVLARLPDAQIHVLGTQAGAIRDHKGLVLTAELSLAQSPALDLLVIPGGPGQQALMYDEKLLQLIRTHDRAGKALFSVCTGALLCGAAGILRGRHATTHWSALDLLPLFGAQARQERVVIDGNLVSAAGVTAGIDGALQVAALLRGESIAQDIQLDIQYAPEPPFNAGSPDTAPPEILASVKERFRPLMQERLETARQIAASAAFIRAG